MVGGFLCFEALVHGGVAAHLLLELRKNALSLLLLTRVFANKRVYHILAAVDRHPQSKRYVVLKFVLHT